MNSKRKSVYKQLIRLFALIVIPYLIAGTVFLTISNRKLQKEELKAVRTTTTDLISQLNYEFERLYTTNYLLLSQTNIQKLANIIDQLDQGEKNALINSIREQLTSINTATSLSKHIRIHFRDWERVYNSNGYPNGSFQTCSPEDYSELCDILQHEKLAMTRDHTLSLLTSLTRTASKDKPAVIIETVISTAALKQALTTITAESNDYYVLLADDGQFQLSNLPASDVSSIASKAAGKESDTTITYNGETYLVFSDTISYINGTYIRLLKQSIVFASLQHLTVFTVIFMLITTIGYIVFLIITKRLIRQPLLQLTDGLAELERGNYHIQIPYHSENDFSYLYQGFNNMAREINLSIERDYNYRLLLQQAEFKQLQAQINPHFLYNSFFLLNRMIKGELWEESMELTNHLGKYFQYITKNYEDTVSLKAEYEHGKIYSQIQEMRFEGRITVHFDPLPDTFADLKVPKLIIQPVIENSYKYVLGTTLSEGLLRTRITTADRTIHIFMEDNGKNLTDDQIATLSEQITLAQTGSSEQISGLVNISRRLYIFSDGRFSLQVARSELGGLLVHMTLMKTEE